jgi:hypothetical protein
MTRAVPVRRRRSLTLAVVAVAVAVAVAVPLLVAAAAHTIADSKAGRTVVSTGPPVGRLPSTPVALLVAVDGTRHVQGLTLLALAPSGRGGTVIPVPAGTSADVTGEASPARLGSAYDRGGLAAQADAIESFLGITLSVVAEARQAELGRLLAPYAPVHVRLDDDVVDARSGDTDVVRYRAGAATLSAGDAATVLLAHGRNESEILRLDRTAAMWRAVVATRRAAPGRSAPPSTVSGFLSALTAGAVTVRPLAAKPVIDAVANPKGIDLLSVDRAATRLLLAEVVPGAISPSDANIRLRIVNPTGDAELSYLAVQRLVYVGANVVLVSDAAGPAPAANVIEYQDSDEADAARYATLFGGATVRPSAEPIDGIDATVVLGQDFRTFMDREHAKATPSTTTSTSPERTTTG